MRLGQGPGGANPDARRGTTTDKAAEVTDRVRRIAGQPAVVLTDAPPGQFDNLIEQYRIEHPAT